MPMNRPCSKHGPNTQRHVLPRGTADNRQVDHAGLAVSHKQAQHPCICFSSAASCLSVGGLQQCACAVHKAPWKSAAVLCCQHTARFCQVQGLEASQSAEHCCKLTDRGVHTAAIKHEPAVQRKTSAVVAKQRLADENCFSNMPNVNIQRNACSLSCELLIALAEKTSLSEAAVVATHRVKPWRLPS